MKRSHSVIIAVLTLFFASVLLTPVGAAAQHGFSVKQYEEFHEVLHPLEHDALPKKDFRRIRAKSSVLVKHGREIVKFGIPEGTSQENQAVFQKELEEFNNALTRFRAHARRGSNFQLKTSYSAVHDSFENLASMLPRK